MKTLLVLLTVIAQCFAHPFNNDCYTKEWTMFKVIHGKSYNNQLDELFRKKVFIDNMKKIEAHNAKFEQGIVSFKMKMNHFGDLMPHEFVAMMNGLNRTLIKNLKKNININYVEPLNIVLPSNIDWRQKGAVTPVKNQGKCGSCWSFSATGSLEGQIFRKSGKLISLSEQNLIDCSQNYGNNGCKGGLMDQAYQYIKDNHGIDTEISYPYEAQDSVCRFKPNKIGGSDKGYVDIPSNENALKKAIATIGPISVAIDASHESFHFYASGIYYEPKCSSTELDHGVLAVGYGTEAGTDYWVIKNSWGESWGEDGYIKIIRNKNNHCGIATTASYPLV